MKTLDDVTINQPVADITTLKAIPYSGLESGCQVYVMGKGSYVWDAANSLVDNSETIVLSDNNSGTGRWLKQAFNEIWLDSTQPAGKMFTTVQSAIDFVNTNATIKPAVIRIKGTFAEDLQITSDITLIGCGSSISKVNSITINNSSDATVAVKNLSVVTSTNTAAIGCNGSAKLIATFSQLNVESTMLGIGIDYTNQHADTEIYFSNCKVQIKDNTTSAPESIKLNGNKIHLHNVDVYRVKDTEETDILHQRGQCLQTGYLRCYHIKFNATDAAHTADFNNIAISTKDYAGINTTAQAAVKIARLSIHSATAATATTSAIKGTGKIQLNPAASYFINYDNANSVIANTVNTTGQWETMWMKNPAIFLQRLHLHYEYTSGTQHTVSNFTSMVLAKTSTNAVDVTLPATSQNAGRFLIIKDEDGNAATNNVKLIGTVDGVTDPTISTNYGMMRIMQAGTNWITW